MNNPLIAGDIIGDRYRIVQLLGQGGFESKLFLKKIKVLSLINLNRLNRIVDEQSSVLFVIIVVAIAVLIGISNMNYENVCYK